MEGRLGHDFGDVRIHHDRPAARSARRLDAAAYTLGNHIVFGAGAYTPDSRRGRRLLAHELIHVAQQRAARPLRTSTPVRRIASQPRIQRGKYNYGHQDSGDTKCNDQDLKNFIWPGHDLGHEMVQQVRKDLDDTKKRVVLDGLDWFFGDNKPTAKRRVDKSTLRKQLSGLAGGFHMKFLYHCDHGGKASQCADSATHAQTKPGEAIYLCMDRLAKGYTKEDFARLLVHEVYHLRFGKKPGHQPCLDVSGNTCNTACPVTPATSEDNPDSYACLAHHVWTGRKTDCDAACKALAGLRRSVKHLCELAGPKDPRCLKAKRKLEKNEARVKAQCKC